LSALAILAKHFFELFKNIAKASSTSLLSELILESLKPCKTLTSTTKRTLSAKGILLLFVPSHACLIVDCSFV